MLFGRIATAMVTPFSANLEIDWQSLDNLIEHLITNKTDTIVVSGTTGESPTLSREEKLKLIEHTVKKVNGRVKVLAGTGSNNTQDSVAFTQEAAGLGIDGVMVVSPYYNKPSQEGIIQHFLTVAESSSVPIMVYNIPGRTSVNISPEAMVTIAKHDRVVAVKESSGDINQIALLVALLARRLEKKVAVYSGDDNLTLPILSVGGVGVVSVASHIIGPQIHDMIGLFLNGQNSKAALMHHNLLPVFNGLFISSNPSPLKFILSNKGLCKPHVRLPLTELNDNQKEFIQKMIK